MTGLSAAANAAAGGHAETGPEGGARMSVSSNSNGDMLLPAEDQERLMRAVFELELLQQQGAAVVVA
jgi:hypothetical protein